MLSILRIELIAGLRKLIAQSDVMHWWNSFSVVGCEIEPR
jgi:hypothetical protein